MKNIAAERGSIWTVPSVVNGARCMVVSTLRGIARGRPEFQVVPIYAAAASIEATPVDFLIRAEETTLGEPLIAALWNIRPISASDLGEQIAIARNDTVMSDLRDAYLRLADRSMQVAPGRLGNAAPGRTVRMWRRLEIDRWSPLTQRAMAPAAETSVVHVAHLQSSDLQASVVFNFNRAVTFDLRELSSSIRLSEPLTGNVFIRAADLSFARIAISPFVAGQQAHVGGPPVEFFAATEMVVCSRTFSVGDSPPDEWRPMNMRDAAKEAA